MALIKCAECGTEISDKAEFCPKCGYDNRKENDEINSVLIEKTEEEIKREEKEEKKRLKKEKRKKNKLEKAGDMLSVIIPFILLICFLVNSIAGVATSNVLIIRGIVLSMAAGFICFIVNIIKNGNRKFSNAFSAVLIGVILLFLAPQARIRSYYVASAVTYDTALTEATAYIKTLKSKGIEAYSKGIEASSYLIVYLGYLETVDLYSEAYINCSNNFTWCEYWYCYDTLQHIDKCINTINSYNNVKTGF